MSDQRVQTGREQDDTIIKRLAAVSEVKIVTPDTKIDEEPALATDTGFTCLGKRLYIEGMDEHVIRRFRNIVEYRGTPFIKARKAVGDE